MIPAPSPTPTYITRSTVLPPRSKNWASKRATAVTIYLPMIPELVSPCWPASASGLCITSSSPGFSAQAIADRVNDSKSKVIITASGGYRRGKILPLKEIVDEAVKISPISKRCWW